MRRVHVLEHAAARPVQVGAVLEDHVDERQPEERLPAHGAHARRGEQRRRDRVGDLVLDQIRAAARPLGRDDHLHVGQVGDRVERRVPQREHAPRERGGDREQRQPAVARARARSDARDHHCSSADWSRLSAAIRKFPDATIRSPGARPRDDLDPARRSRSPISTRRGSSRPSPRSTNTTRRAPAYDHGGRGHEQRASPRSARSSTSTNISGRSARSALRELEPHARRARLARRAPGST